MMAILVELQVKRVRHPPYQSYCKGKVEAANKIIKNQFQREAQVAGMRTLDELNSAFWAWMDLEYNVRVHSATGQSPDARFRDGLPADHRRITDLETFNALFLWRERRTVSKYGRIKLHGNQYPVTAVPHGSVVEVRFDPTTSPSLPSTTPAAACWRPPALPNRSPHRCRRSPRSPAPSRLRCRPPPGTTSPACASSTTPGFATVTRLRSTSSALPPRSTTMQMHDHVLSFFGFSRLPFGKHLQPADTFPSTAHQEALSRLSFGVADEDLLLLTGPIGCGKSVALAAFVSELDGNRYRPLYVRGAGLSEAQLYKAILDELKIDPPFFAGQAKQLFFKTIPELTKKPLVILRLRGCGVLEDAQWVAGREDYLDELAALRPPVKPVLLAGGTHDYTPAAFAEIGRHGAFDRWQPDVTYAGDITGTLPSWS